MPKIVVITKSTFIPFAVPHDEVWQTTRLFGWWTVPLRNFRRFGIGPNDEKGKVWGFWKTLWKWFTRPSVIYLDRVIEGGSFPVSGVKRRDIVGYYTVLHDEPDGMKYQRELVEVLKKQGEDPGLRGDDDDE